ncbi:uncharacterized protein [Drosophila virilis]|uniref:Uncharacterized protein n=1 Tax=Drosophila virilis TaxID=7244 RepID=B4LP53_DROVI|nr:uncharacterized protein LOC6625612 isoform X1 [Drosophila virilis]EDW62247.2 uncharacterized protein Dvir_GJ22487 [Drosophila virilis]
MERAVELEEEEELQVSITFDELQCFDCEDVSTCVSKQTAIKICNKSLEDLSAKTVEVLSLWLRKLLRAYINEAECCIDVFKCLYEWFLRLKDDVTPENKAACSDFILLLNDALGFAEWAKAKLLTAGERLVHTTAFFLLAIVYSCLQLSNENNVQALREHEPVAIELHLSVLSLLQEITATSRQVHARITPLLRQLVEIADFLSVKATHLHAFVKTSKTMTNICTHYNCLEPSRNEARGMPDWLQETVLHLCDTVLNQLEAVYQQQGTAVDKMEEYLKVSQVYLIMLHKLLGSGVTHMDKTVLEAIMLLLSGGETKPSHDVGKDMPGLVAKYMRTYVMHIYELLYQLEDFQKHLIACLSGSEQTAEDYNELCLDYVTVCIMDHLEISQPTCRTLQKVFEYLCKDGYNFVNAARYKRILEAFGSLLHLACSAALYNYFCAGLFQEDIIKSQVCADVLMLSFRLEEVQSGWRNNALMQATNYWIKCNNSYAMFSQNLSQLHVRRMLKYFHSLSNNEPPAFNIRNYRYLHCICAGVEQQQRLWLLRLQRLLNEPLSDIEQYYEILALMELLSTGQVDWLLQVSGSKQELLLKDTCKRLANVYFKLALQASPATKLRILQTVTLSKSVANSCWHVQRFLHACQASDNAQLKSLAERHAIATELRPLLDAVQPARSLLKTNAGMLDINYTKFNYARNQTHHCQGNQGNLKRKRAQHEPKELIRLLEQNAQQLVESAAELDASDLLQLSGIVNNLKHLLPDQNIL